MRILSAILLTLMVLSAARAEDAATPLSVLRHAWAKVYYQSPKDQQEEPLRALAAEADALARKDPQNAELLILKAMILSTYAEAKGGLGALPLAETARDTALQAAKLDERADDAGAYTALGVLYYKVPGWPIGFGNNKKARAYLDQALALAPDGVDVNYFTGDFLLEQGDEAKARIFLEKALQAPPRPGRADEDAGRRREIEADLARLAN